MHSKERLLKDKENEVSTKRNLHSTVYTVIGENNHPDIQTVQGKEKRDKETTNESPNATIINDTTIIEILHGIFTKNNFKKHTTSSNLNVEKTKIFTSEKEERVDNFIEERLIKVALGDSFVVSLSCFSFPWTVGRLFSSITLWTVT